MERTIGRHDGLAGAYSYADIAFYMAQLFGARMARADDERIRGCLPGAIA
jgi:hypothetical protein